MLSKRLKTGEMAVQNVISKYKKIAEKKHVESLKCAYFTLQVIKNKNYKL